MLAFHLLLFAIASCQSIVSAAAATTIPNNHAATVAAYAHARLIRAQDGHDAAQGLYQQLLLDNPSECTAATRIAASPHACARQDLACNHHQRNNIATLRSLLEAHNYTNAAIQEQVLRVPTKLRYASCPVFVSPAAAGSGQYPPLPQSGLETLVALFLLGIALPKTVVEGQLGDCAAIIVLLQELGLAFLDDNLLVPYVHLFPLALPSSTGGNMWLATDLHPRCLSTTTVGTDQHHAVMYIGPDSLALVQHLLSSSSSFSENSERFDNILDICTGSGIQALSCLLYNKNAAKATCVDINPRALKFVQFNAALNGIADNRLRLVLGDVVKGDFKEVKPFEGTATDDIFPDDSVDLLLANPPFIPVPDDDEGVLKRYGLFSSGGSDGEVVLKGILQLASRVLKKKSSSLIAIVSEFMNPNSIELRQRLREWCPDVAGNGVLLTNEFPVSAETYAARRADSESEFDVWKRHLEQRKIIDVSPGLLFLQPSLPDGTNSNDIQNHVVPRTDQGSIWTPSNEKAVEYTKRVLSETIIVR